MDIFLLVLAILALIVGLAGSLLPFPGPPISFLGILFLHWTRFAEFSSTLLWTLGLLTVLVTILDLVVPIWGIKKFGGSRYGIWGSTLGLIIGMTTGPWGIFIGAFVGGFVGELIAGRDTLTATKAATGSFIGFLTGVLLKLILSTVMIWYAIMAFF